MVCINNDDNIELFKQNILSFNLLNIKYVLDSKLSYDFILFYKLFIDKYSIGLHFKSWLQSNVHENEQLQLYVPEVCTARTAALGQKNSQNYFRKKSIFISWGQYLCIVYVKVRVKKQNVIDRTIIIKRKPNFIKFYFK